MHIQILDTFSDNRIYLVRYDNNKVIVIDPGIAEPIVNQLSADTSLTHILATHHHADHIGGIAVLKSRFNPCIISPDPARIHPTDRRVQDKDIIAADHLNITVIATPGHTSTSVCYYIPASDNVAGAVFTGDTLFAGGCGRLFEGTAQQMHQSLTALAALPPATRVYPGHNYTLENLQFALTVEPDNPALRKRIDDIHRNPCQAAISTIELEKQTNPFLRTDSGQIRTNLAAKNAQPHEVLAELRSRKNHFG